jgi:hypothetical protein
VPFDRVGLHAYQHGPEWLETMGSRGLAMAAYAAGLGKAVTLGEFNWKGLTRLSPEDRRRAMATVYAAMLEPRSIPEFFQFHFQETLSVNPAIARVGIRHYETIALDRRPKPEALELMRLIRQYARADAPVRELSVSVADAVLTRGSARVPVAITNMTSRRLTIDVVAQAFDGLATQLASPARIVLGPGERVQDTVALALPGGALPGTYHHFVEASYEGKAAWGWGVAANPGAPSFEPQPVLGDRVDYPQGPDAVARFDWTGRPLGVAFGKDAPVLELEMAYLVANTLQAATGRPVWLSSTADLPDSLERRGALLLVGTRSSNPLVGPVPESAPGHGVIFVPGPDRLLLTGADARAAQAAATDLVLRYWRHAKDAAIRVTGMERGAAFGDTAGITPPPADP